MAGMMAETMAAWSAEMTVALLAARTADLTVAWLVGTMVALLAEKKAAQKEDLKAV